MGGDRGCPRFRFQVLGGGGGGKWADLMGWSGREEKEKNKEVEDGHFTTEKYQPRIRIFGRITFLYFGKKNHPRNRSPLNFTVHIEAQGFSWS